VRDENLFVAILADDTLLVISLVEYKAKMGTEMKDSFFFITDDNILVHRTKLPFSANSVIMDSVDNSSG
jgi:hypothetical protein